MRKRFIFGVALLTVTVLSACGTSDEVDGGTAQMISGQVAGYAGPAGTLEAIGDNPNDLDDEEVRVGTGSMGSEGSFKLELDPVVDESALYPVTSLEACPGISISEREAMILSVELIAISAAEEGAGYLALTDSDPADQNSEYTFVRRYYADRDVSVKGKCGAIPSD